MITDWETVQMKPPHDKVPWVKIQVFIKEKATNEEVSYLDEGIFDDGLDNLSTFIWSDGNYSCDCNRQLFFDRAKGQDYKEEIDCGEGKFSVNIVNPKTGETVYREYERENK